MLHPFFSYFGSKYRLSKLYSIPTCDTIIEPFAGSAGYSLMYPNKTVILYEKYEPIVALWDYLIHVKEEEILSLPIKDFTKEESLKNEQHISSEAKILIGFWLTESQTSPSLYPLSKSRGGNWTQRKKYLIAKQLCHIRHWKIEHKSYEEIDDQFATWFIDPPYQEAGKRYKNKNVDYIHLAQWSKNRTGQVIVCEQEGADWLEFDLLVNTKNASNKSYKETVWENIKTTELVMEELY